MLADRNTHKIIIHLMVTVLFFFLNYTGLCVTTGNVLATTYNKRNVAQT